MRKDAHEGEDDRVRLDKWLWAARFFKTRALAAEAITAGHIEVNGDRPKRAKPLQTGDEVRVRHGPYLHVLLVRGLSDRRGPASIAATLYEETAESRTAREKLAAQLKLAPFDFGHHESKPTKRDRREIEKLRRK